MILELAVKMIMLILPLLSEKGTHLVNGDIEQSDFNVQ